MRPEFPPEDRFSDDEFEAEVERLLIDETELTDAILEYRYAVRQGVNSQKAGQTMQDRIDYLIVRAEEWARENLGERSRDDGIYPDDVA